MAASRQSHLHLLIQMSKRFRPSKGTSFQRDVLMVQRDVLMCNRRNLLKRRLLLNHYAIIASKGTS